MRLIDADKFKENVDFICDAGGCLQPVTEAVRSFLKFQIDAQTTVLTEHEVVRCKDCKNFRRWINTDIEFCDITESAMDPTDFCSRAERMTTDD